jgi:hypothetical protein
VLFWRKSTTGDLNLPKNDRGSGSFDDYLYDLLPKNRSVTMRLADATAHQDEIAALGELTEEERESLTTATPARTLDQERVDAPIEVRVFSGRRVTGVVGVIPRGLENVYDETVRRLEGRGDKPRIPVAAVRTKQGWRVDLLMGRTK